jgi:hypothetical protein
MSSPYGKALISSAFREDLAATKEMHLEKEVT